VNQRQHAAMHRDKTAYSGVHDRDWMHLTQLDDLQHLLDQKPNGSMPNPNQKKSAGTSTH
jgi:hypothetical protein